MRTGTAAVNSTRLYYEEAGAGPTSSSSTVSPSTHAWPGRSVLAWRIITAWSRFTTCAAQQVGGAYGRALRTRGSAPAGSPGHRAGGARRPLKGGGVTLDFAGPSVARAGVALVDTILGRFAWSGRQTERTMTQCGRQRAGGIAAAKASWLAHPLLRRPCASRRWWPLWPAWFPRRLLERRQRRPGGTGCAHQLDRLRRVDDAGQVIVGDQDLPDFTAIATFISLSRWRTSARLSARRRAHVMANMEAPA